MKRKSVFNKRLKSCEDVPSFTVCLLEMFETYNTYFINKLLANECF